MNVSRTRPAGSLRSATGEFLVGKKENEVGRHLKHFVWTAAIVSLLAVPLVADEASLRGFHGVVVYRGQRYPKPEVLRLQKREFANESLLVNPENGGIANVVLLLIPIGKGEASLHKATNVVVEASDARYSPRVAVLRPGDTLHIRNVGTVGHNVDLRSFIIVM